MRTGSVNRRDNTWTPILTQTPSAILPTGRQVPVAMGSIERALMPLNQMPPDVDVPLPPHMDQRAEILRALDQFSSTRSQTLTMDLALGRVLQQTLAALTGSYLTQPMMRELYSNIAAMSQIASASRMTTTAFTLWPTKTRGCCQYYSTLHKYCGTFSVPGRA